MWQFVLVFLLGALLAALVAAQLSIRWARKLGKKEYELLQRTHRAERLAELGKLTGHLAHEIRNPLSTIKLNLQLLAEDTARLAACESPSVDSVELSERKQKFQRQLRRIETITKETDRLADTLTDFLRYAGRMEIHPQRTDVNELLDELIDFYEPQALSKNVQIRRNLNKNPAFCKVDPELLKPALLNLFINAIQAMENGGELILATHIHPRELLIEITDTGPGIPPQQVENIFNAYYTTKPQGTGLGLPTCRRIIEEHHGHIKLHSEPGKGSRFTITLPLMKD